MMTAKQHAFYKILVSVTYVVMIVGNALANIIPINGVTTGEVSDSYSDLFAPAGFTFAIWGLIYLLLAAYVLYQLGIFQSSKNFYQAEVLRKVAIYFSISSVANALWIFSWHYHQITLSMLLMLVILICLILIVSAIRKEDNFVRFAFSVYFGWITVATIANATTLLVSLGWDGFGISEPVWTVIILLAGLLIGSATIINYRDMAYGLVVIWAYAGILAKHTLASGFAGQYPAVMATAVGCIVVLLVVEIYILLPGRRLNL